MNTLTKNAAGSPVGSPVAAGVETLIARLRGEGVEAGRMEAERLVSDAKREAARLLRDAEAQAKAVRETAQREADALRRSGEEALQLAMRDTLLRLKAELTDHFSDEVKRLIATKMDQGPFLEQLILEVAGRARAATGLDDGAPIQVQLPRALVNPEELRRNPLELREGSLTHFVLSLAGNMLADGVSFGVAGHDGRGLRLALEGQEIHIDVTDEAVAATLLAHLQPRFRAILEGMVR